MGGEQKKNKGVFGDDIFLVITKKRVMESHSNEVYDQDSADVAIWIGVLWCLIG